MSKRHVGRTSQVLELSGLWSLKNIPRSWDDPGLLKGSPDLWCVGGSPPSEDETVLHNSHQGAPENSNTFNQQIFLKGISFSFVFLSIKRSQ